jgi:hypothetical protein
MAERLERRFHSVIAENLADTECVLRQHSDDLLQLDNFDVLLDAHVLPARKMTLDMTRLVRGGSCQKEDQPLPRPAGDPGVESDHPRVRTETTLR